MIKGFKEAITNSLVRLMTLTGIGREVSRLVLATMWDFKSRLALVSLTSLVSPGLELAFIGSLYLLISPEKQQTVISKLNGYGFTGLLNMLGGESHFVFIVAGFAVVALILTVLAKIAYGYVLAYLTYAIFIKYSERLLFAYMNASPMTVLELDKNIVANAVTAEAGQYGKFASSLLSILSLGVSGALFLSTAGALSVKLMLISIGIGLSILFLSRRGYTRAKAINETRLKVQAGLIGYVFDILDGFRIAKIEGAEGRIRKKSRKYLQSSQRWRIDARRNEFFVTRASEGVILFLLFATILVATLVLGMDAALMLIFLIIMARLQKIVLEIQGFWILVKEAIPSLNLVYDLITRCERAPISEGQVTISKKEEIRDKFPVRFEDVAFKYPKGGWVLQDINLELVPGDRVLIQGTSGEGKSTLMLLFSGLLAPTKGSIFYDNHSFNEELLYQVRSRIAYAAPDAHLFRNSIRENLCLGKDYKEEEIQEAIDKARLGEVVANLPGGLDGFIGENGSNLSLGERQRVMLARIFLKKPHIVFLDEATTNLDLGLEEAILKDLVEALDKDSILIMIAHRKPTNVSFNRQFIMKEGRLAPVGIPASPPHS